jgi:acetolactate synthase I/II/III large subunit
MAMTTAGDLIVECLLAQGVEVAFGVPGESYLPVLEGFHKYRDRIRFVTCRQEGGAAFMAEAHGKLTGRPGVCLVTRGPGATNASIGVHTAFQDSTPMVLLVGDVGSDFRHREAFQEIEFTSMFGPSTGGLAKRVERIDDPARIPEYISRAFATATNGRPGPVVLVLPEDMLHQRVEATPLPRTEICQAGLPSAAIQALNSMLRDAQRPFVIAGGRWSPEGARALQAFAEAWKLPVGNAFRFQDTFDNHHPLYAGDVGIGINPKLARTIRDCDLVIAFGARLGEMTTSGYSLLSVPRPTQKLVHIHPCADELHRVFRADLAICATAAAAAGSLRNLAAPPEVRWAEWANSVHADYEANVLPQALLELDDQDAVSAVDMPAIIAALQRQLPADAVLTNGAGNFASWVHRYFRYHGLAKGYKTQLAPTNGAMGYGIPAAIAAKLTTGRAAVAITGDGDFLMNGQELATAALHGCKVIVVLINNGMYGTIRMHQEREYPRRVSGTTLFNPDFCMFASAFGMHAQRVESASEFEGALRDALTREKGTLLEIRLSPEVISTRATLRQITEDALRRQAQEKV